ncbi:MAG TPA: hypothetical protein VNE17_07370 [Nitrolancea sp.]|nr:hypothetical protein [Nitrolancea sp.]
MSEQQKSDGASQPTRLDDTHFIAQYRDRLSESTLRAKWIISLAEHEDRVGQTLATRDHEVIREWAEERDGIPSTIQRVEHDGQLGLLDLDFPGYDEEDLQHIDWDEWFAAFDLQELVFVYQEHKTDGDLSSFFHFDGPLGIHDEKSPSEPTA